MGATDRRHKQAVVYTRRQRDKVKLGCWWTPMVAKVCFIEGQRQNNKQENEYLLDIAESSEGRSKSMLEILRLLKRKPFYM